VAKGTISGSYSAAITLTSAAYTNPVTVTGTIDTADSNALYAATAWTVDNAGLIRIEGTTGSVVELFAGGAVYNSASGRITGGSIGVNMLHAAGTVGNAGLIQSLGTSSYGYGVRLSLGGTLTNSTGGTITAATGVVAASPTTLTSTISNAAGALISGALLTGVDIRASTAVLDNAGTISGQFDGAYFATGTLTNQAGGTITAASQVAVEFGGYGLVTNAASAIIAGARDGISSETVSAVIDNAGLVTGSTDTGVILAQGGTISNASSGTISGFKYGVDLERGSRTVLNAGSIMATNGTAVQIQTAGTSGSNAYADNTGTIIGSADGIDVSAIVGTINNGGVVRGTDGLGVRLHDGGTVSNVGNGTIAGGGKYGVFIYQGVALVNNFGSIAATNAAGAVGVEIRHAGSVNNAAGATITAVSHGILFENNTGTVFNAGTIASNELTNAAVAFDTGGGTLTNSAGGLIVGGIGVYSVAGANGRATVINAGTIEGTGSGSLAVNLIGGSTNVVALEPGATFIGIVDGGNFYGSVYVSTLELGAGVGAALGFGTNFRDFNAIAFDADAHWKIAGSTVALAGGQTISGFAAGSTIELYGVNETISNFANGTLSLDGTKPLDLLLPGSFQTAQFTATQNGPDTDITVACFRAGARILTGAGEVPVEALRPGDVICSRRTLVPVTWVGSRRVPGAAPVRVAAAAFGAGRPHRTLWLSPDHAVLLDGILVPVRHLINGSTVVQEPVDEVTYYHVELAAHDVILAEGLPCESYLDTGNRAAFAADRQLGGGGVRAPGHSGR
jgi:hypothetical protein